MDIALITGSGGLVGSEAVRYFSGSGFRTVGIDNDMRRRFFGDDASTAGRVELLRREVEHYTHHQADIRSQDEIEGIFSTYGIDIRLVVHCAAQPSHDWAARDPQTDFDVNARATLGLLETARRHCPETAFVFVSTNKVYGDTPNRLPLVEKETRWELDESHPFHENGIDETMSVDRSTHSVFGVSKLAADAMVQEYGRNFGMNTACFRAGCITGPGHAGAELHGFLHYLMKCTVTGTPYTVYGYKGKQVRDNIHSLDLVRAFHAFYRTPGQGEVYNIGGSRFASCSVREAISLCEKIAGRKLEWTYSDTARIGDHIWWISDVSRFRSHCPEWQLTFTVEQILEDIHAALTRS